jgi:hypothetical protein
LRGPTTLSSRRTNTLVPGVLRFKRPLPDSCMLVLVLVVVVLLLLLACRCRMRQEQMHMQRLKNKEERMGEAQHVGSVSSILRLHAATTTLPARRWEGCLTSHVPEQRQEEAEGCLSCGLLPPPLPWPLPRAIILHSSPCPHPRKQPSTSLAASSLDAHVALCLWPLAPAPLDTRPRLPHSTSLPSFALSCGRLSCQYTIIHRCDQEAVE